MKPNARFISVTIAASLLVFGGSGLAAEQGPTEEHRELCASFGFQTGTPQFAQCLFSLFVKDQERLAEWCRLEGARIARTDVTYVDIHLWKEKCEPE